MNLTRYDWQKLGRALAIFGVLLMTALGIVVLTDEAESSWAARTARSCALAPALAAIAGLWVQTEARRSGEARALRALGCHPVRVQLASSLVVLLVGVAATLVVLLAPTDPGSLFITVSDHGQWESWSGGMRNLSRGVEVFPDGRPSWLPSTHQRVVVGPGRGGAAVMVGSLSVGASFWLLADIPARRRVLGAMASVLLTIIIAHWIAATGRSAWFLAVGALPLVVQSAHALIADRAKS